MIFKETQRFTQWWVWLIIIVSDTIISYTLINAFIQQIIYKEPWGNQPMSDTGLSLLLLFVFVLMALATWLLASMKLELEIKNDTLYYRFKPIIWSWKRIHKSDIHNYEVRSFNRLLEYGGLGYRRTLTNGTGLIIKGNQGLFLIYGKSKKKLMIGTQQSVALQKAMDRIMAKSNTYIDA